ncbi:MAG: hypothetical protein H8E17_04275 [Deltaproteobacteria bacterium]|nr:hypothetical protein [Deltaproteobacteria bacterium]
MVVFDQVSADPQHPGNGFDGHQLAKIQEIADESKAVTAFSGKKRKLDPSDLTAVTTLEPSAFSISL